LRSAKTAADRGRQTERKEGLAVKVYDVIVVGSGSGMLIVEEALSQDLKVALVDKGPYGGTCLNLGCIPSKTLIYPADVIVQIQEAKKLGIDAEIKGVDFGAIMERMRKNRRETQSQIRSGVDHIHELDFYEGEGHFVADYTLEFEGEKLKGKKIFLASGSRPLIPPIKGLDSVDYLTNESALELTERPESIIMIGGGYVAVEFAHFFAAMGTKVTILEMLDRLAQSEEREISALLERAMARRMEIHTGTVAREVRKSDGGCTVVATKGGKKGSESEFSAERVMVAVGRRSNADLLKVENTNVAVDDRGFVKADEYLETSKKGIYAVGDANGRQMFLHVANREAALAWHNATATGKKRIAMDYGAVPHAIFSHPQVASVGLTEEEAGKEHHVAVGRASYSETAKGEAMMEEEGFAKAVVDEHTGKILGFHVIGPHAPILVQEVVNAMAVGGDLQGIYSGLHIHPALPELVQRTFSNME
jgi:mycothione reductase